MQPLTVSLSCPDGASVSMTGRGAIIYAADGDAHQLSAIGGELTVGNLAQLMTELIETFGPEDVALAMSLALVAHRMQDED